MDNFRKRVLGGKSIVYVFSSNKSSISLNSTNETSSARITSTADGSTCSYSVSSKPYFVTATINGSSLSVSATNNTSTSSRSGTIVLLQSGSNKTISISVTQSGGTYYFGSSTFGDTAYITVPTTTTTSSHFYIASRISRSMVPYSVTSTSGAITSITVPSSYEGDLIINFSTGSSTGSATLTQNGSSKKQYITVNRSTFNTEEVDLGLPSGLKWAKCNVGATSEEGFGYAYSPGEGATRYARRDDFYIYYSNSSGIPISLDPARATMLGSWRLPTFSECTELVNNTTQEKATINGVSGVKFISKTNSNYIFVPCVLCAGAGNSNANLSAGNNAIFMTSTSYGSGSNKMFKYVRATAGLNYANVSNYFGMAVRGVHA